MNDPPAPERAEPDPASASVAERPAPVLRVVRGEPTPEELAALIAVVAARAGGGSEPKPRPRSAWNHPSRLVRGPVSAAPERWRHSSHPG